jgi:protein TonB
MRIRSNWFQGLAASALLALFAVTLGSANSRIYPIQVSQTAGAVPQAGSNGIGTPSCSYCPKPKYSEQALKAKYEGTVILKAVVTPEGRATNIAVVKGPGRLGVEKRATETLQTWRFKPAADANGKPVAVVTTVDITFRLP